MKETMLMNVGFGKTTMPKYRCNIKQRKMLCEQNKMLTVCLNSN